MVSVLMDNALRRAGPSLGYDQCKARDELLVAVADAILSYQNDAEMAVLRQKLDAFRTALAIPVPATDE